MTTPEYQQLRQILAEISDMNAINAMLNYDQSTIMPAGGGEGRGRQMALMSRLSHEKFTAPEVGRLLDIVRKQSEQWGADSIDAAIVQVTAKDYDQATRVPGAFVSAFTEHMNTSYMAWAAARPANDFASMIPLLERTLEMSRALSGYYQPDAAHVADPLIDMADSGMTVATLRPLFATLRDGLVPMVQTICEQPATDDDCLRGPYPIREQIDFAQQLAVSIGYDMNRGRLDTSPHPFCSRLHYGDVRMTTRAREDDLGDAIFSVIHETGHSVYEQGVDFALEGTSLAQGTSSGVHESQSRLWENIVGRSYDFWTVQYPRLQAAFPAQLAQVSLDTFYRAINKVSRSLIRTDADEVTYNLHIIIRFELELAMLEGSIAIKDLAEIWHERYRSDIGMTAPDNRDGVLQDVHWYAGTIGGAFQGYTIGNVMSAQIYEAALAGDAGITPALKAGNYAPLLTWLQQHLYATGRRYDAPTTLKRVTGADLSVEPYFRYLKGKYSGLYGVSL